MKDPDGQCQDLSFWLCEGGLAISSMLTLNSYCAELTLSLRLSASFAVRGQDKNYFRHFCNYYTEML